MPSILYNGNRYIQMRHAMYCKKCKQTIQSKSQHDFVQCSCGAVMLDGGIGGGNRVLGYLSDMEDRSVYVYMDGKKKIYLPTEVLQRRLEEMQEKEKK